MGRQGAIRAVRAAMKREGRKPEEIPSQPPSFTQRHEAILKMASALEVARTEVKRLRAEREEYQRDAEAVHTEACQERDALKGQVENLEAARAELADRVSALEAEIARRDEMLAGLETTGAEALT